MRLCSYIFFICIFCPFFVSASEEAVESELVMRNMEEVDNFLREARLFTESGYEFLIDLEEWSTAKSDRRGEFLIGITFNKSQTGSMHVSYQGRSVTGVWVAERSGIIRYDIGRRFQVTDNSEGCNSLDNPNLDNICVTISTALSAEKLGLKGFEDITNGRYIPTGNLMQVKLATDNPGGCGTTIDEMKKSYDNLSEGKVKCGENIPLNGGAGKAGCEELIKQLNEDADCTLWMTNGLIGHGAHVHSATQNGDSCNLIVANTGNQGKGGGKEVPAFGGVQEWGVSSSNNSPQGHTSYKGGVSQSGARLPSGGFWGAVGDSILDTTVICCNYSE